MEGILEEFQRLACFEQQRLDVFLEVRPARESIFTRDDELRVAQRELRGASFGTFGRLNASFLKTFERGWFTIVGGLEEFFGLFPELFQVWPRRKWLRHKTFLLSPVVRSQAASRFSLYRITCRRAQPFPRTRMRPETRHQSATAAAGCQREQITRVRLNLPGNADWSPSPR